MRASLQEILAAAEEEVAAQHEEDMQRADRELMAGPDDGDNSVDSLPSSPRRLGRRMPSTDSPSLIDAGRNLSSPEAHALDRLEISGVAVALGTPTSPDNR